MGAWGCVDGAPSSIGQLPLLMKEGKQRKLLPLKINRLKNGFHPEKTHPATLLTSRAFRISS